MGDLTRRDKAVPVQARRLLAASGGVVPVTLVDVPGLAAELPAVPPGGGIQNVVYVVAPAAAAAPVVPPPSVEVHHHHHTTEVVYDRRPRRRAGKGTSFLGTLGLVIGGLACGTAFLPQVSAYAGRMAEVGLGLAALAWVGAVVLRRVGATMPFVGALVSAAGYGLWLYQTGQAQGVYDHLRTRSPVPLPAVRIDPPVAVPTVPPTVAAPPAAPPAPPAKGAPKSPPKPPPTFFGM